jgi:hypothetical protein
LPALTSTAGSYSMAIGNDINSGVYDTGTTILAVA